MHLALPAHGLSCLSVDEYISIAKEKHGYNMEQVTRASSVFVMGLGAATRCGGGGVAVVVTARGPVCEEP